MPFERRGFALAIAIALAGCAGRLAEGESAFRRGDYPEAKRTLGALEASARSWPDERRAEYALYLGLTFAALGDGARADRWLEKAKAFDESRPGSLSPDDVHRLETALEASCPVCAAGP
jgi:hypothetical protein